MRVVLCLGVLSWVALGVNVDVLLVEPEEGRTDPFTIADVANCFSSIDIHARVEWKVQ